MQAVRREPSGDLRSRHMTPGCLRSSAKIALTGLLAQLRYNYKYLRLAANTNGTAKPVMQAVRREPSGDLPRATHHRAACAAPLELVAEWGEADTGRLRHIQSHNARKDSASSAVADLFA